MFQAADTAQQIPYVSKEELIIEYYETYIEAITENQKLEFEELINYYEAHINETNINALSLNQTNVRQEIANDTVGEPRKDLTTRFCGCTFFLTSPLVHPMRFAEKSVAYEPYPISGQHLSYESEKEGEHQRYERSAVFF